MEAQKQKVDVARRESPAVSVIMPVYNCEPYLQCAVESVLSQTFGDFELIIVNDGSIDGSWGMIQELARSDCRIRAFSMANGGIVAALNYGLSVARGKYVARMDGDDISLASRFEEQVAVLERDASVVVCGTNAQTFGEYCVTLKMPTTNRACKNLLLSQPCFLHPTVMMRREALPNWPQSYEAAYQFAEDFRLWSVLASRGKFTNIAKVLLHYRIHPGQVGSRKKEVQQRIHTQIAYENFQAADISIAKEKLEVVLWPNASASRFAYLREVGAFLLLLTFRGRLAVKTAGRCIRHAVRS